MSNNQIYFVSGKVVVKSGIFFEKKVVDYHCFIEINKENINTANKFNIALHVEVKKFLNSQNIKFNKYIISSFNIV